MSGLLISAAHKSSGKTTISLGLSAALRRRGTTVQTFKKGPDYIDPLWLTLASGRPCYNLDFNTQDHDEISALYQRAGSDAEVNLIEGNKGLYDGLEVDGSNSNAALAAHLDLPVVLVIDCQGMTRGVAPLVLGYLDFEPKVNIAGVILNKLGGDRHEQKLRAVLQHYTDVPVIGAVQRDSRLAIDERHLGLVPSNEAHEARSKLDLIASLIGDQVDLNAVAQIANGADPLPAAPSAVLAERNADIRIGVPRDRAFAFYYPDDLDQFDHCGAEIVFFDTQIDGALPAVDGLFIGGGFPETQMAALEANASLRVDIRRQILDGLPAYAECGGLMYLTESIQWGQSRHDMVGVIPAQTMMHDRPAGRGYTRLRPTSALPWHNETDGAGPASEIHAHEFHYSSLEGLSRRQAFGFKVLRGTGIDGEHDGIVFHNLVACYTHQRHTRSNPWVTQFTDFVRHCKQHTPTDIQRSPP